MNQDYLWDRSGPPDPEVARLEKTLGTLRYRPDAGALRQAPRRPSLRWMAAAAGVLVALAGWQMSLAPAAPTAWQISRLNGASVTMAVRAGQVLETGGSGAITMEASEVGSLDIGPDSEFRAASSRKVELERGRLHAFIWARPGQFAVDTPSARALDLGCEYTLTVAPSGDGLLRVSLGWVAFQAGGHEAFIPAGAECVTRRRGGPGIPYYEDSAAPFREALASFETGQEAALGELLPNARPRDGLTLWHLLTRVPAADRGRVYDRFAELVPVPPAVTRAAALAKDPQAIDRLWDALNLENTEWWRGWERPWK